MQISGKIVNHRKAVRAVITQNNKVLLVQSNKGDYKLPGGGIEEGESDSGGLIREVGEETGYINIIVKDKIGSVIERKIDAYDSNALFQMTSYYYFCELASEQRVNQKLDNYELEQEFTPKWVSLDDAIHQNEKMLIQNSKNKWIERENYVLKELKKTMKLDKWINRDGSFVLFWTQKNRPYELPMN
ncbi:NUDIX domain-containing protein [Aquibacillus halophilus]|uniref:NUDIX domain-containing protein n=2 Tax=Aquibacillus halophilus TaxID=930132 RepID=A0A6A8DE90_9BACI|nr:NUDIX domain-containing protein [Aquibacillus halophilus]MRH43560.1 NUDIX domain-containing protein [Aquibacillus halophilus]